MAATEACETATADFIFINHNAKRLRTIKDRSHRAVVNQHVQKAWLKNRKPKDAKHLDPSAQSSETTSDSSQLHRTDIDGADSRNGGYPTPPSKAPPGKPRRLITFRAAETKRPKFRETKSPDDFPFAPFNILTHGNSDPFNTLAVPLDATVSRLLQYSKEVMWPSVYGMEVRTTTPSLGILKSWQTVMGAFRDECAISAYLAISATSVNRISKASDLVQVALRYNTRSSALLRQRIEDSKGTIDPRLYVIVLWLSANAMATGDYTAGMIHAQTLNYLVRQGGGIMAVELFQRESVLHFDVQFAIMYLRRPFFDAEEYAPETFNTHWLNDPEAVTTPSASNTLTPWPSLTTSLTSPTLITTISDLRTLYSVYAFTLQYPVPGTSPILRWMYLQKHAAEARLLSFCCDQIYSPITPITAAESSALTPPQSCTEVEYNSLLPPFCVAALYWTAMAVGHVPRKIHACNMMLIHLRSRLSVAAPHLISQHHQNNANPNAVLRLWILYVGCMAEQVMGLEQAPGEWRDWCTLRFVQQTRWMGIQDHAQCRDLLASVLFAERMHRETGKGGAKERVHGNGVVAVNRKWEAMEEQDGEVGFEKWYRKVEISFGGVVAGESEC